MELLVLGGTRFVGRALVTQALERGHTVTALHRGVTGTTPCETLTADRTSADELRKALQGRHFDAVLDTWSGDPAVVDLAASTVDADSYAYVSTVSVYEDGRPRGGDESWPTVDPTRTDYSGVKRAAELAVLQRFPDALLGRPGLILGPYEDIGRLPWWLDRASRGGRVVAPGRPERPIQYVDVRDLADWFLDNLSTTIVADLVCPSGHTTTGSLLEAVVAVTGNQAELVWVDQDTVLQHADPWVELPCWVPEGGEFDGFMESSTAAALATGLRSRPVADTVADTWAWLQDVGMPAQRPDRPSHGLPETKETALLASVS